MNQLISAAKTIAAALPAIIMALLTVMALLIGGKAAWNITIETLPFLRQFVGPFAGDALRFAQLSFLFAGIAFFLKGMV